jgi:hypothetical protein
MRRAAWVTLVLAACGLPAVEPNFDEGEDGAFCEGAGPNYPIRHRPPADAEERALDALASLAAATDVEPSFEWDDLHGTFRVINQLGLPLEACAQGASLAEAALAAMASHPGAFPIDPEEWVLAVGEDSCAAVGSGAYLTLARTRHAGQRWYGGNIQLRIGEGNDGVPVLVRFQGLQLIPPAPRLHPCLTTVGHEALLAGLFEAELPYDFFYACQFVGSSTYRPRTGDALRFVESPYFTLRYTEQGPLIVFERQAILELAEEHWSELEPGSATGCTTGHAFSLWLDAIDGTLWHSEPGTDCVIC